MDGILDLGELHRRERHVIFAGILNEHPDLIFSVETMKKALKSRNMAGKWLGQELNSMKGLPFVASDGKGGFFWNSAFKGTFNDALVHLDPEFQNLVDKEEERVAAAKKEKKEGHPQIMCVDDDVALASAVSRKRSQVLEETEGSQQTKECFKHHDFQHREICHYNCPPGAHRHCDCHIRVENKEERIRRNRKTYFFFFFEGMCES